MSTVIFCLCSTHRASCFGLTFNKRCDKAMKKSELIEHLLSSDDEYVYLLVDDTEYDITFDRQEETFDGFCTAYPAAIILKPTQINQEDYDNY